MKNVYVLANAMKVVESACVEGEITIIGNGKMPTAEELYHKCVEYINSMYGVDILAIVGKKCSCGCECCDEDEDEETCILVDFDRIDDVIKVVFDKYVPWLKDGVQENILASIIDYYEENVDKCDLDDYDEEDICDDIFDILDEEMPVYDYDEDYIDDFIKELVSDINKQCISEA